MRSVGLVGLGAMGLPMARTLASKSFVVLGHDANPERRSRFDPSTAELMDLQACEAIILSLPNDAIVLDVAGRLLPHLRLDSVVIDTSTVSPQTTRKLAQEARARGIGYVDAPVSGGAAGAATGALLVMCGGDSASIGRARPVLEALARKVVVCGGPGAGNVVKLLNNALCAGQLILAGEALRLAAAGGVAATDFLEAVNAGSGRSAITEVNLPRWVLSGAFDSAFSLGLMAKDVALAASLEGAGPVFAEIAARWKAAAEALGSAEDFNRIVTVQPT